MLSVAVRFLFCLAILAPLGQLSGQAKFPEQILTNHPANDRYASYSSDGKQIVFESDRNGNWDVFLMDEKGGQLFQLTRDAANDRRPCWHPDGRKVLFESTRDGATALFEINTDGSGLRQVMRLDKATDGGLFARYSPDGSQIAYATSMEDICPEIYIMKKNGKGQQRITFNEDGDTLPHWRPDGKKLLITGYRGDNFEICEIILSP